MSDKFFVGRAIFAKLKGSPPWPAVIQEILPKNRVKVKFIASNEQWYFQIDSIFSQVILKDFFFFWSIVNFNRLTTLSETNIYKYYGKNKAFTKAIDEWVTDYPTDVSTSTNVFDVDEVLNDTLQNELTCSSFSNLSFIDSFNSIKYRTVLYICLFLLISVLLMFCLFKFV